MITRRSIYGKKFSQQSLPSDLRGIVCGQPIILYGLTYLILFGSILLSGVFSGLFGAYGGRIAFTDPSGLSITLLIVLLTVSFTWIWNCVYCGFSSSLWRSFLIAIVLTVLAAIALKSSIFIGLSLLFNFLALGSISLALLSCVFALFLINSLSRKQTAFSKRIIAVAVVSISTFIVYHVGQDFPEKSSFSQDYFIPTKLLLGFVTGVLVVAAGLSVTQLEGKATQNFRFLRLWTIAFAAWGGTSFYDLDVSNVDFSGANLANSDFRVRCLHRSILRGVTGLELARVDSRYLDLENAKVQKLLTQGIGSDRNFSSINLRGAYIDPKTDLRDFDFTCANLTGANLSQTDLRNSCLSQVQATAAAFNSADLRNSMLVDANCTEADFRGADLRGSILVRAQVARADFTGADMTGVCIEDWSVSSKTCFTNVRCDYIYRKYQNGERSDPYPVGRTFELGEFAALYAEPEDVVELVFKGDFNIAALSLALHKLQTDVPELNLELRGIEQRENLWVAKIRSTNDSLNEQLIEEQLALNYENTDNGNVRQETIQYSIYREYEETKRRLAESEQLISQLAAATGSQAIALKELSQRSTGNVFNITESNVGNIVGTGKAQQFNAAEQNSNREDKEPG